MIATTSTKGPEPRKKVTRVTALALEVALLLECAFGCALTEVPLTDEPLTKGALVCMEITVALELEATTTGTFEGTVQLLPVFAGDHSSTTLGVTIDAGKLGPTVGIADIEAFACDMVTGK